MGFWDDFIGAGRVINDVIPGCDSNMNGAERIMDMTLVNETDETLIWDDSGLDHGMRSDHAPDEIHAGKKGFWSLESDGVMTGCEGWMHWKIGSSGPMLKLDYNNPYYGSNDYSQTIEGSGKERYEVQRSGGDGNYAKITWTVKLVTPPSNDDSDSD